MAAGAPGERAVEARRAIVRALQRRRFLYTGGSIDALADELVAAACDPALGEDRLVRLGDVVDELREVCGGAATWIPEFVAREFGLEGRDREAR